MLHRPRLLSSHLYTRPQDRLAVTVAVLRKPELHAIVLWIPLTGCGNLASILVVRNTIYNDNNLLDVTSVLAGSAWSE
jgi:hypothetical protein